jgi:hypothetical protein
MEFLQDRNKNRLMNYAGKSRTCNNKYNSCKTHFRQVGRAAVREARVDPADVDFRVPLRALNLWTVVEALN